MHSVRTRTVAHGALGALHRTRREPGGDEALARLARRHHHQVLERRHVGEFVRDLEGAQHTAVKQLVRLQTSDIFAVEDDLAAVGRDVAGDEVEQRRLAGTVRPDEPGDRSPLDPKRALVDCAQAAKALADVLHVDDCVEGHPTPVLVNLSVKCRLVGHLLICRIPGQSSSRASLWALPTETVRL